MLLTMRAGTAVAQDTGHALKRYDRAQIGEVPTAAPLHAQRVLYDYGWCLAKFGRKPAERFVATVPFSPAAADSAKRLAKNECLADGTMSFNPEALRGPIYQALYRLRFGPKPVGGLDSAPAILQESGANAPVIILRAFADCVVRRDASSARALIMSDIGKPEETAAFTALVPSMGACVAKDSTVELKRPLLRGLFAESLYKLSVARSAQTKNEAR
jgi:hypothetical protein